MSEPLDSKVTSISHVKDTPNEFAANVSISEIKVKNWDKFKDKEVVLRELDNEHNRGLKKAELGWLGVFLGSGAEKAGNIAFLAILTGAVFVFCNSGENSGNDKIILGGLSIITLALGYLFGANNNTSPS